MSVKENNEFPTLVIYHNLPAFYTRLWTAADHVVSTIEQQSRCLQLTIPTQAPAAPGAGNRQHPEKQSLQHWAPAALAPRPTVPLTAGHNVPHLNPQIASDDPSGSQIHYHLQDYMGATVHIYHGEQGQFVFSFPSTQPPRSQPE